MLSWHTENNLIVLYYCKTCFNLPTYNKRQRTGTDEEGLDPTYVIFLFREKHCNVSIQIQRNSRNGVLRFIHNMKDKPNKCFYPGSLCVGKGIP